MATTTKRDFSNYGSLAKMARRYSQLCEKHSRRSVYDVSPEAMREYEAICDIDREIEALAGYDLATDITFSARDGNEWVYGSCYTISQFGFRLGVASGFGFTRLSYRVPKSEKESYLEIARMNNWECIKEDCPGEASVLLHLINKRQVKD